MQLHKRGSGLNPGEPGSLRITSVARRQQIRLHHDPAHRWQLRSDIDLTRNLQLDLNLRERDELTLEPIPGYHELNARLSWQPRPVLEVALSGRNLLDNDQAEFGDPAARSRLDRSILPGFCWTS